MENTVGSSSLVNSYLGRSKDNTQASKPNSETAPQNINNPTDEINISSNSSKKVSHVFKNSIALFGGTLLGGFLIDALPLKGTTLLSRLKAGRKELFGISSLITFGYLAFKGVQKAFNFYGEKVNKVRNKTKEYLINSSALFGGIFSVGLLPGLLSKEKAPLLSRLKEGSGISAALAGGVAVGYLAYKGLQSLLKCDE